MKYVLAGAAIIAAIVALLVHPPHAAGIASNAPLAAASGQRVSARARIAPRLFVYVAGEVQHPGVYRMPSTARTNDALVLAGGAKSDADLVAVNLAAALHDGDEIAVPKIGANAPRARRTSAPRARSPRTPHAHRNRRAAAAEIAPESVDLNLADVDELQNLPGVGPALAARIVAYREVNGPFASIDELADVSGVSPHLLDAIAPYVSVSS